MQSFAPFWYALAAWNTLVALINANLWHRLYPPEMLVYMTPTSQWLPIAICLGLASYCEQSKVSMKGRN